MDQDFWSRNRKNSPIHREKNTILNTVNVLNMLELRKLMRKAEGVAYLNLIVNGTSIISHKMRQISVYT